MTAEERVLFHYRNLDSDQLHYQVLYELDEIEPKYIDPLKEILLEREVPRELIEVTEAFRSEVTEKELDQLCDHVAQLDCPRCDRSKYRVGAIYGRGIPITPGSKPDIEHRELYVGCGPCLQKIVERYSGDRLVLNIVRRPFWIFWDVRNYRQCKKQLNEMKLKQHTEAFRDFVKRRRGLFVYRDESIEKFRNMLFRL